MTNANTLEKDIQKTRHQLAHTIGKIEGRMQPEVVYSNVKHSIAKKLHIDQQSRDIAMDTIKQRYRSTASTIGAKYQAFPFVFFVGSMLVGGGLRMVINNRQPKISKSNVL